VIRAALVGYASGAAGRSRVGVIVRLRDWGCPRAPAAAGRVSGSCLFGCYGVTRARERGSAPFPTGGHLRARSGARWGLDGGRRSRVIRVRAEFGATQEDGLSVRVRSAVLGAARRSGAAGVFPGNGDTAVFEVGVLGVLEVAVPTLKAGRVHAVGNQDVSGARTREKRRSGERGMWTEPVAADSDAQVGAYHGVRGLASRCRRATSRSWSYHCNL